MARKDYKVFGDKLSKYYVTINAESPDIAWDAAANMDTNQWEQVPTDYIIEPYAIEEIE